MKLGKMQKVEKERHDTVSRRKVERREAITEHLTKSSVVYLRRAFQRPRPAALWF